MVTLSIAIPLAWTVLFYTSQNYLQIWNMLWFICCASRFTHDYSDSSVCVIRHKNTSKPATCYYCMCCASRFTHDSSVNSVSTKELLHKHQNIFGVPARSSAMFSLFVRCNEAAYWHIWEEIKATSMLPKNSVIASSKITALFCGDFKWVVTQFLCCKEL